MAGEFNRLPPKFPVLETDDYVLRAIGLGDVQAMHAYLTDPNVTQRTSYELKTLREVESLVHFYQHAFARKTDIRWAIAPRDGGTLLGSIGLTNFQERFRRAEIGYELAAAAWGKGVATAVVSRVLGYGFEELELNRIEATVMVGNTASERVLEKAGFSREGVLREYKFARGEFRDYSMFSMLDREWVEARARSLATTSA